MWRDIKNYEGLYQVSDKGEVRSLNYKKTGKVQILKPAKNNCGYLLVTLSKNGKRKGFLIHRLVAEAFIPNPDNLSQVNHKDEIKTNNNYLNLEWCTASYNNSYGTRIERVSEKRTGVFNTKISKPVKQFDLRGNFIQEFPSIMEVERKFGYNNSHISSACNGKRQTANGYRWSYA